MDFVTTRHVWFPSKCILLDALRSIASYFYGTLEATVSKGFPDIPDESSGHISGDREVIGMSVIQQVGSRHRPMPPPSHSWD